MNSLIRLENGLVGAHIRGMRKLPVLVSAALLAAAILFLFRNELHARGPHRLGPATQCGFWDDMSAGMSCR
jgi:hypothetical protein